MGAVCGKEEETSNSSSSLPQQSKIYPALEDPDDDKEQLERQSKEAKVIMEEESPEQKLYSNVILATKNALGHLESFGDAFVEQTFQTDFHSHHMTWLDMRYDWFVPYEEVRHGHPRRTYLVGWYAELKELGVVSCFSISFILIIK